MSQSDQNCKCNLKYKLLSVIDNELLSQIKLVFITSKNSATEVIFITNSDNVYGFGTNVYGRLGFGTTSRVDNPTVIPELCGKEVKNVEFGHYFMIVLTKSLEVYSCGYDYNGMLGNGTHSGGYIRPQRIDLSDDLVVDIKCCAYSTYILNEYNEIYYFGYRSTVANSSAYSPTLKNSFNKEKIGAICCGFDHTLVLTDTGKVYAFGLNNFGQLGSGSTSTSNSPRIIEMSDNIFVKSISCGNNHSLLLTTDGNVYSFGDNRKGQLGSGRNKQKNFPQLIQSNVKFNEIYAFEDISMAMSEGNEVYVWGQLSDGSVNVPIKTSIDSIQEAINTYSKNPYTFKPLLAKDLFTKRPINSVIKTMSKSFNNQKSSDLKFKLKRKDREELDYIYVHKWFIENTSEYFDRMFANNWSESNDNEIEIKSYSYEAYYQFIQCLYTDVIETEEIDLLIEILSITEEYLDEDIKTKCVQSIKPLMNVQNVCSLYSSSLRNRSKELEVFCFKFMSENMSSITETEDYEQMDSNYAKHFLTRISKNKN